MASPTRILVLDDDPVSSQLMSEILQAQGYVIELAGSAAEVMEKVAGDGYGLLVSDIIMPGTCGTDLAARIRRLRPRLPILLVTAFPSLATEAAARALGVPLLAKPFGADALIGRVGELVGGEAMHR